MNSVLVVDRNFGELPIGSVCVADVQYKGRGLKRLLSSICCCFFVC